MISPEDHKDMGKAFMGLYFIFTFSDAWTTIGLLDFRHGHGVCEAGQSMA